MQEIFSKHGGGTIKRNNAVSPSFLKGIIRCKICDTPMIPTYCVKNGMRYRYYASRKHQKFESCNFAFKTVPAGLVKEQVVNEIIHILKSPEIFVHIDKLTEENKEISREYILDALKNSNDVWEYLYQAEQRNLVNSLQI